MGGGGGVGLVSTQTGVPECTAQRVGGRSTVGGWDRPGGSRYEAGLRRGPKILATTPVSGCLFYAELTSPPPSNKMSLFSNIQTVPTISAPS